MPVAQKTTQSLTAPKPLLIPVGEVARLLGISTRTVWRLVSGGEFVQPVRLGSSRSVRWRLQDVEAYIENGCQPLGASGNGR